MALKSVKKNSGGMSAFKEELATQIPTEKNLEKKMADDETKPLLIRIPAALHTKLKLEAVSKGFSMREIVEGMIAARYN